MSKESLNSVLDAARKLPLKNADNVDSTQNQIQAAVEAVERSQGTMQGLDRDTIIRLAEDEELCGY